MTRARALIVAALVCLTVPLAIVIDAGRRRAARDARAPIHDAVVALTGTSDLALSSSARWLRHPSQAEPGAAFSDLPSSLDVDPAGAWIGPPRAILRVGAVEHQRRSGR